MKLPPSSSGEALVSLAKIHRGEPVDGRLVTALTRKGYTRRLASNGTPGRRWELTPRGAAVLSEVLAVAQWQPSVAAVFLSKIAERTAYGELGVAT